MSAMTNLLVKDDAATPVEFTFIPVTDTPQPIWRTNVSGVPQNGQHRVTILDEVQKDGKIKRQVRLDVSVMETLGASGTSAGYVAPPKVAYVNTFWATGVIDPRSTPQDVANLLKIAVGLLQGASSTTATGVLDQASAGSAFGNSTLPITQFMANGIVPN